MSDWRKYIDRGRALAQSAVVEASVVVGRVSAAATQTTTTEKSSVVSAKGGELRVTGVQQPREDRYPVSDAAEQSAAAAESSSDAAAAVGDVAAAPDAAAVVTVAVQPQGGPSLTAPDVATATVTPNTCCDECRQGWHMPDGEKCACCRVNVGHYLAVINVLMNPGRAA